MVHVNGAFGKGGKRSDGVVVSEEAKENQIEAGNDEESGEQVVTDGAEPEAASEQPVEEGIYYPGGGK
jgi:hypothetical protein